jgi:hypothetical protein
MKLPRTGLLSNEASCSCAIKAASWMASNSFNIVGSSSHISPLIALCQQLLRLVEQHSIPTFQGARPRARVRCHYWPEWRLGATCALGDKSQRSERDADSIRALGRDERRRILLLTLRPCPQGDFRAGGINNDSGNVSPHEICRLFTCTEAVRGHLLLGFDFWLSCDRAIVVHGRGSHGYFSLCLPLRNCLCRSFQRIDVSTMSSHSFINFPEQLAWKNQENLDTINSLSFYAFVQI